MKDLLQAVYEYISGNPEIQAVVQGRIFPVVLPQDEPLPAIVYAPVVANYDSALQGDTGYVRQTIQFVCHEKTFKKARKLSRLVKKALQDYTGDMNGVEIQAVFIKSDYELNGNTSLKFDTEEYMSCIEFDIHYNEK